MFLNICYVEISIALFHIFLQEIFAVLTNLWEESLALYSRLTKMTIEIFLTVLFIHYCNFF